MRKLEEHLSLPKRQMKLDDGLDEVKSIDAVALTVISACVGVNASDLPQEPKTFFLLVVIMVGLYLFHRSLRVLYSLVYFQNFKRAFVVFALQMPACVIIALTIGEFVGNLYLGGGLMFGWAFMFAYCVWGGFFQMKDRN